MVAEPKAKNSYRLTRSIWSTYTQDERHHFNKMFVYLISRQHEFNTGPELDRKIWQLMVRRISAYSTSVYKRGKRANYWRNKKTDP